MKNYDVVTKLIGSINPIGESNTDSKRFENLKEMTELVQELLSDISRVASYKNQYEHSVKKAGEYAYKFLKEVKEGINE